jgi:NAD(P)-dependent dehydrogenase (short-subunit alcohol dehydrogenase family)
MDQQYRLDHKVAVVIGGSGVLGSRMAATLAGAGAETVIAARDPERGQHATQLLQADGHRASFVRCDAGQRDDLAELVATVADRYGRIDVVVNGAGINSATPFLEISDDELEQLIQINQLAVVRACQEFGRYFVDRASNGGPGASIINVGSASGLRPLSRVFTYSMAKAAVHNLTKNLAREWGPLGIRCNVLVPGFFPAEQNRAVLTPDRVDSILHHTPMGRFGEPDDLDGALLLLASDAGRFITGSELVVDGGFNAVSI